MRRGMAPLTPSSRLRRPPDLHRSFKLIRVLQQLPPEVQRQRRVAGKVGVYHTERRSAGLPPEKRGEPGFQEEDPPMGLNVGQGVERRAYKRQGQSLLLQGIEGAEAARGPVLVEAAVGEVAGEVRSLGLAAW